MRTTEELIDALARASEIEHGVCCMYLFSAFALRKGPDEGLNWRQAEANRSMAATLLSIAREEMAHLGAVTNILLAIAGRPHLWRPSFPQDCGLGAPLELQPLTLQAVERYMALESIEAFRSSSDSKTSIAQLYGEIRDFLASRDESLLFFGARTHQLSIDFPASIALQPVRSGAAALAAVDSVIEAGDSRPLSHLDRLRSIHQTLQAELELDPHFVPSRPVVSNPASCPRAGASLVTNELTLGAMQLFNDAYGLLLLLLARLAAPGADAPRQVAWLASVAYFPMMTMVIRPLAELLTTAPAGEEYPGMTAGPPFETLRVVELPADSDLAWVRIEAAFASLVAAAADVVVRGFGGHRGEYIHQNLQRIHRDVHALSGK